MSAWLPGCIYTAAAAGLDYALPRLSRLHQCVAADWCAPPSHLSLCAAAEEAGLAAEGRQHGDLLRTPSTDGCVAAINGPPHLGLWLNARLQHKMALFTSGV